MLETFLSLNGGTLLVGCVVFLLVWIVIGQRRHRDHLPPGPTPLPIIGNALQLAGKDLMVYFRKLRSEYGDVFTIRFGPKLAVVIHGYEALHDAMVKQADAFSGRVDRSKINAYEGNEIPEIMANGIISCNIGPIWKKNRRFTLSTLRDFGMGRNKMQIKIHEEIGYLLKAIEKKNGEPFNIKYTLSASVSNIICSIVFGKRYEYDDEEFLKLLKYVENHMSGRGVVTTLMPTVIKRLPFIKPLLGKPYENLNRIYKHFGKLVDESKATFNEENIRSFVDAYINESRQPDNEIPDGYNPDHELGKIILDIFVAGTDTTTSALHWSVLYALHYPDLQKTTFSEIADHVGTDRLPGMEDRRNLPYTEASSYEILRHAGIAPIAVPHAVTKTVRFRDYIIPKDTMIFPVLDSAHKDPQIWEDPYKFDPRRFLDEDKVKNFEQFIPFGIGKRICVGESLARMEMFLVWSALVQNFEFLPEEDGKLPPREGKLGMTHSPLPYLVRAVRRRIN